MSADTDNIFGNPLSWGASLLRASLLEAAIVGFLLLGHFGFLPTFSSTSSSTSALLFCAALVLQFPASLLFNWFWHLAFILAGSNTHATLYAFVPTGLIEIGVFTVLFRKPWLRRSRREVVA